MPMADSRALEGEDEWAPPALRRRSSVPLYYQLQELLHQQIASGRFSVGDVLPSETDLCAMFGVSRMVVRQALEVLEDDGEVIRMQGKGTYVAEPKLDLAAGGLVRMLGADTRTVPNVEILDVTLAPVEKSVAARLGTSNVLRVDWLLRLRDTPAAIAYSFLRPGTVPALERAAARGSRAASAKAAAVARGLELHQPEVSVSSSHCSPYNAELLGIESRAPVFLVDVTEIAERSGDVLEPVEVARVIYRSDMFSLRLETTTREGVPHIAARISGITSA
jgi:GntR family transcriptional regulator